MELKVKARRWGNSIAFILPKLIVDEKKIRENDEITVEIKKRPLARETFGILKNWKRSTQEIKDEMRRGWD